MSDQRVNVINESGAIVGRVRYNDNLDYWNGSNFTCGATGRHRGLTMLKDGSYVLINGTQWQGEQDRAEIITEDEAVEYVLKSGNTQLLDLPKFKGLKLLADQLNNEEE